MNKNVITMRVYTNAPYDLQKAINEAVFDDQFKDKVNGERFEYCSGIMQQSRLIFLTDDMHSMNDVISYLIKSDYDVEIFLGYGSFMKLSEVSHDPISPTNEKY